VSVSLPTTEDMSVLGVAHLARMWARATRERRGLRPAPPTSDDVERDRIVLHGLGLGVEPTMTELWGSGPTLTEFQQWIVEQCGGKLDPARVRRVNAVLLDQRYDEGTAAWLESVEAMPPVLDANRLACWQETGLVVVPAAINTATCAAARQAVWDYLGSTPADPTSWYPKRLNRTMVQLFQHPALEAARRSPRVHKAFAQLWGTPDLLMTTDRCGFNPPENDQWLFPGPGLHFDVALEPPVPFGIQGLLYLTDTAANQGAFTCVPGFHRSIDQWLANASEQERDGNAPGLVPDARPVPGQAGDLVLWDSRLPHGSSPNRASFPRIVLYLTMAPPFHSNWVAEPVGPRHKEPKEDQSL
jgi:Phytanoyl-CoA dioxygenase (PhyH)